MKNWRAFSAAALLAAVPLCAQEAPFRRLKTVTHVHSVISPNSQTPVQAIADIARKRKIDAVFLTDHYLQRWEYGLAPLDGILRTAVDRRGVMKTGPSHYAAILKRWDRPEARLLPGLEVSPAHYWTGHPFQKTLTLHEPQRHLLVLGLENPSDVEHLPVLSNRKAWPVAWRRLAFPVILTGMGLGLMIRWPAGLLLAAIGFLWGLNQRPFHRAPDAYEKFTRDGYDAAQTLIDYVNAKGGVTVWAHPEAREWAEPRRLYRSVSMTTKPYPDALLQTRDYTGFAYFWEGEKTIGVPGGLWDQALAQFARGERARPPWAFGELDWTGENRLGVTLDQMQNVVWTSAPGAADAPALLDAFRAGRFYVYLKGVRFDMALERWEARAGGRRLLSGEKGRWAPGAQLALALRRGDADQTPKDPYEINGKIYRNGEEWRTFRGRLPVDVALPLPDAPAAGRADVYRAVIKGPGGSVIVMNPVFLEK